MVEIVVIPLTTHTRKSSDWMPKIAKQSIGHERSFDDIGHETTARRQLHLEVVGLR
jgi:hypothetical protein